MHHAVPLAALLSQVSPVMAGLRRRPRPRVRRTPGTPGSFAPSADARILRRSVRAAALLATPALLAALAGCSGEPVTPAAVSTAPVVVPGRPGEQARTFAPGESVTPAPAPSANAADVRFVRDMVVHHRQAIDMSLLAPSRASSDAVKRLASRINDAQELEIGMMTRWLREQGQRVPDHHADHQGMPGMATPEQLARLRDATGPAFDRLFVDLMINHHHGALTMANQALTAGSHTTVQQLAADISVEQAAEIRRMRQLP